MCEICKKYFCPPSCPSFDGISLGKGKIIGACKKCGRTIFQNQKSIRKSEMLFCESCASNANMSHGKEKDERSVI